MVVITNETTPKKPSVTNEFNTAGLLWLLDQCFTVMQRRQDMSSRKRQNISLDELPL